MTGNPFLQQVVENPDDDAARLVYADYLEEQGDPRSEFIRVQCELARTSPLDSGYEDLSLRSEDLLDEHRDTWVGGLAPDVKKAVFERGFIATVTMLARKFLEQGEQLFQEVPVKWLRLNRVEGVGEALAAFPALGQLRALDLSSLKVPNEDLRALLGSPHLTQLQQLDLEHLQTDYDDQLGGALGSSPAMSTLRRLLVRGYVQPNSTFFARLAEGNFPALEHLSLGVDQVRIFPTLEPLGAMSLPKLQSLRLRGPLNQDRTEHLTRLPLQQLRQLDLDGTSVPAKGLRAIAERGGLQSLDELSLLGVRCGKQACDVIFGEGQLSNCQHLQIGEESGGKVLAARLAAYPFPRLRQLAVSGLLAGEAGGIAQNEQLAHLESLRISNARFSPRDLAELMHGPWRPTLRALGLYGSSREAEWEPWGDTPSFDRLLRLDLGGDLLTQYAFSGNLIGLLLCCRFPSLQELRLTWCGLRPDDFDTLAQAELPELRRLDLRGTRTAKRDILRLLKPALFPKLRRIHVDQPMNLGDYDGPVQVG